MLLMNYGIILHSLNNGHLINNSWMMQLLEVIHFTLQINGGMLMQDPSTGWS